MKTLSIQFTVGFVLFGFGSVWFTVLQKIVTRYKAFPIKHPAHSSSTFYAKQVIKEKKIRTLIMGNIFYF